MLDIALEVAHDKWLPMLQYTSWMQYGIAAAYLVCAWMCVVSGSGSYQAGEKAGEEKCPKYANEKKESNAHQRENTRGADVRQI